MSLISIIIPLYNEDEVITDFYTRLDNACSRQIDEYEYIFVDDGSSDSSVDIIQALSLKDEKIILVSLSRNYGKEAAMTSGLKNCQGDAAIIIDADLQDPPELIPQMVLRWKQGSHVVCMKRFSRKGESYLKKLTSKWFYKLINSISDVDIPEDVGDFRLLSRPAINAINELPERCRYMKGIFSWVGFNPTVISYDRDPRYAGTTKWNYASLFLLAIDGITSFSTAPLRLVSILGFITAGLGMIFGGWIIIKTLMFGESVIGYPSIISLITVLSGIQLISIGILGEYIGKSFIESKKRPIYIEKSVERNIKSIKKIDRFAR